MNPSFSRKSSRFSRQLAVRSCAFKFARFSRQSYHLKIVQGMKHSDTLEALLHRKVNKRAEEVMAFDADQ
jgi:hypothetical protein